MSKKLGLLLNSKAARFTVHQSTLEALGEPNYVQFLINAEKKMIVLLPCEKNKPGSVAMPKPPYTTLVEHRFRFKRSLFIERIFEIMGWELGTSYQAWGQFSEGVGGAVFRLEDSTEVPS